MIEGTTTVPVLSQCDERPRSTTSHPTPPRRSRFVFLLPQPLVTCFIHPEPTQGIPGGVGSPNTIRVVRGSVDSVGSVAIESFSSGLPRKCRVNPFFWGEAEPNSTCQARLTGGKPPDVGNIPRRRDTLAKGDAWCDNWVQVLHGQSWSPQSGPRRHCAKTSHSFESARPARREVCGVMAVLDR